MSNLSRREFVQAGIATGAVLALNKSPIGAAEAGKTVRVGMVGMGERGTQLTETLLALPEVVINAVCDIAPAAAEKAQRTIALKTGQKPQGYTKGERDWENLVARDDLDCVINAAPWEWHAPIALATMNSGKYAGTEVPAAITVDDAWELIRTSAKTGMPCMMLENVCYFRDVMA